MNKILHINLGGYPFTIDEDAYLRLSQYLKNIAAHFKNMDGFEEVTEDIENRFADLLTEAIQKRRIVALADVEQIITKLGTPEEIGDDPMEDSPKVQSTRRLYRDEVNQMVAGVCAGLANYSGITSPNVIRLLFVLLAFIGGIGIIIYAILWSILPAATSASERLAMHGEPINLQNLGKMLAPARRNESTKPFFLFVFIATLFKGIRSITSKLFKIMLRLFKPIFILIAIILIIGLTIAWLASIIGAFLIYPSLNHFLSDQAFASPIVLTNLLVLFGIPIISLLLITFRLAFKIKIAPSLGLGLFLGWLANLSVLAFSVVTTTKEFSSGYEKEEKFDLVTGQPIHFHFHENLYEENNFYFLGPELYVEGNQLVNSFVHLHVKKSEDDQFHIVKTTQSRGPNRAKAQQHADKITDILTIDANQVNLYPYFFIREQEKFRAQDVEIELYIPEGQNFTISGHFWSFSPHGIELGDLGLMDQDKKEQVRLEGDRMICLTCGNPNGQIYPLDLPDFNRIQIDAHLKAYTSYHPTLKVDLITNPATKESLDFKVENQTLIVRSKKSIDLSGSQLNIGLPHLTGFESSSKWRSTLADFKVDALDLKASSGEIRLQNLDIDSLALYLEGDAELYINGAFKRVKADLHSNSHMETDSHIRFGLFNIQLHDRSQAHLETIDTLYYKKWGKRTRLIYHNVLEAIEME